MLIAQISDSHMLPPGEIAYGQADTEAALRAAVAAVNRARPDVVIHTGDFAHHGAPEAYALALEILQGLDAPLYAIPGNHDDRNNMRAAFAGATWMPAVSGDADFIHFAVDCGPIHIIACDTMIPGETGGALCADRLSWLETALDAAADKPTIIAMHHPPFPCGLPGFGKTGLGGAEAMAALLAGRENVIRIIAGHNHRAITGMCGGVPACVAPSVSYPFAFETIEGTPLAIANEPPGCAMHLWREDFGLLTHTLSIGDFGTPKPLR
jgi:3',5'-cyclic AMP phosphodiesterase CpdA